ncbi:hypothetical protein RJ639_036664 [Escallonia herrerae]|uniref:Nodulation signaling pathway 1-like protein n=1 Tax=Escallonia herrerae TaxID=1293975 RepID=A0AA88WNA6_9ASTE|nr:hypothetical protein RJ639_036664 [Escallonia herrerae]
MIKHQNLLCPPVSQNIHKTMAIEEPEPNPTSEHILDWLEGSISYLPSFFDDPYSSNDISGDSWWIHDQDLDQELINNHSSNASFNTASTTTTSTTSTTPNEPIISNHLPPFDSPKKRKATHDPIPKASQTCRKNQNRQVNEGDDKDAVAEQVQPGPVRKAGGNKKGASKSAGGNGSNGNNKEGRWAEQLLNPCAAAIATANPTRVQHLLYVLYELASPTGDANHRLADHGLRALTHHLSSTPASSLSAGAPITFASAKPKFFQQSIINFNDINPWFHIPNSIANSSILQILSDQDRSRNLHIVDIGVSHGVQWPTLLEALTRRPGGPPPLVRLTVIAPTDSNQTTGTPFATGPPGYNFSSQLLGFAKAISINLQINRLDNQPLQSLNAQAINSSVDETLIICAQFRLHHLNHNNQDSKTEFLKVLRSLEPKGVILSENNMDCSCSNCGDFATGFSQRVEYLWRFLDSTSAAFKGRESEERRMMEGEAAKALTNVGEMNEKKEKWCERMRGVGFAGELFGEDAIDGARALLRKYDSNWEMRVEDRDGCVGLWWKGQPVSFCSLWKIDAKTEQN